MYFPDICQRKILPRVVIVGIVGEPVRSGEGNRAGHELGSLKFGDDERALRKQ